MTSKHARCLRFFPSARPASAEVSWRSKASFATTSANLASPPKTKSGAQDVPRRGSKSTRSPSKKPGVAVKAKPPNPGERKAVRKKIVLSNPNALDVPKVVDVETENVLQQDAVGKIMGIPSSAVDCLRTLGSFRASQGWRFFGSPSFLIREETKDLAKALRDIDSARSNDHVVRTVIVGERGSGKSMHLLQATVLASLREWVVISIPEGS